LAQTGIDKNATDKWISNLNGSPNLSNLIPAPTVDNSKLAVTPEFNKKNLNLRAKRLSPSFKKGSAYSSMDFIKANTSLEVTGLSEKYEKAFKEEFPKFLKKLSGAPLYKDKGFFPIVFGVDFKDGKGVLNMNIHYSPKDKNVEPVYQKVYGQAEFYLVFENQMLLGLRYFLNQVMESTGDYGLTKKFDLALVMKKEDGSLFCCGADAKPSQTYNVFLGQQVNFYQDSYVMQPTKVENVTTFDRIRKYLKVNYTPTYKVTNTSYKVVNNWNDQQGTQRFLLDPPFEIDGKKTNSYWFYKYFEIPISKKN
jgi:hypothetical protein